MRRLLPQIALTVGICKNYRLKIAATRSKAELTERMDAGTGTGNGNGTGVSTGMGSSVGVGSVGGTETGTLDLKSGERKIRTCTLFPFFYT